MGVRGLSAFVDYNPVLLKDYKLHDCQVLVDGNNLIHFIYYSYKLDCVFGGDYHRFSECIKKYLTLYTDCNIRPIVIFDGAYNTSDRKFATVRARTYERLKNAQHIVKYGCSSGKLLPILAVEVMKTVLEDMHVTFLQCDYEADEEITVLANYYKCPILSQDSDFYIFDISHGFIRLDLIENAVLLDVDESGNEFKYLKCQIYRIDHFLSFFPGMSKSLLPLFSILMGNDYIHISAFDNFYSKIKLPKFKSKLKISQRHRKMIGLLTWLQNRSLKDAIEQVLSHVTLSKREEIRTKIEHIIEMYCTQNSVLIESLQNSNQDSICSSLKTFHEKSLPLWFINEFRCGKIPPFLLNVIGLHRVFFPSQVEDMSLESSFTCSLYVRQIIYNILLSYDLDSVDMDMSLNYVEEYDRRHGNLQKEQVQPVSYIDGFGAVPSLQNIHSFSDECKEKLMSTVIGDELEYFCGIPKKFQLLFGCVRYWLRVCNPKPSVEILHAFLLTTIFFDIILSDTAHLNEFTTDDVNSSDLANSIKNIKTANVANFCDRIKKYFLKPQFNSANPINFRTIHFFCQLQTCVLSFSHLNKLLCNPFMNINFQGCFNGTVFYNLVRDLSTRTCSELYLSELLGRDSVVNILFKNMKNKVLENISKDSLARRVCLENVSKKKKKKVGSYGLSSKAIDKENDTENNELFNKFACLSLAGEI